MDKIQKINLKYKINNICTKYFSDKNFSLYYHIIKDLIKKEFKLYLINNIHCSKKKECIVCYNKKKYFFNFDCCNNNDLCIDCLKKMLVTNNFKCVICRKNFNEEMIFKISRNINLKIYENESVIKKFLKRKRKLIKQINNDILFKKKIINQLKNNGNEVLFNNNGFYFQNLVRIEILDLYFFKLFWKINDYFLETFVNIKNNIIYFEFGNDLFIKFQKFI